jgi:hypothetical protein
MKHKWHNEIKAWADGARIQYKPNNMLSFWETYPGTITPAWNNPQLQFRIFREWYDNIPKQGRLCWVGDNYLDEPCERTITVINRYSIEEELFISFRNVPWRYAVPLTDDEIKQFLTQE